MNPNDQPSSAGNYTPRPDKELYFCRQCGECCRWPGYVRMTEEEVDRIAGFLGMPAESFIERYTEVTADRRHLTLIEKENGYCCFFDDPNTCHIYPVRPVQCKRFPNKWAFPGFEEKCDSVKVRYRLSKLDGVSNCYPLEPFFGRIFSV